MTMQEERDKLWDDIQRMERRRDQPQAQYEATGNSYARRAVDTLGKMLKDMYFQLYEMAKSDSDRMHYTRH